MNVKKFVASLTPTQIGNWKKLIAAIINGDHAYNHGHFELGEDDESARCALSFAAMVDLFAHDGENDYHEIIGSCSANIANAFGDDCFDMVFDGESTFYEYLINNYEDADEDISSKSAAEALGKFLELDNGIQFVTVHWKSNQKDNFESVEALASYFKLNPHRAKGYRKLTATKLVARTVFDEVVETITL